MPAHWWAEPGPEGELLLQGPGVFSWCFGLWVGGVRAQGVLGLVPKHWWVKLVHWWAELSLSVTGCQALGFLGLVSVHWCWGQVLGPLDHVFLFILPICLLIGEFNPFALKVITDMKGLTSIILQLVFYIT